MKDFDKTKVYVYCDPRHLGNYIYQFKGGVLRLKYKPFYIGCAGYNNYLRHLTGNKSSEYIQRRIKKIREKNLEPIIKVLKVYESNKKARKLEKVLIVEIGRQDLKTGPLLNKADGRGNYSQEARERRNEKIKQYWSNSKHRKKRSKASRKMWENPEYRKKMIKIIKKRWKDSEYRKNISKKRKEMWKNPEFRKNISKKLKEIWKNPELRKRVSEANKGEKNLNAKVTEKEVLEIRKLYKEKNISQNKLAEKFEISRSCIRHIIARHTWTHI